MAKYEYKVGDFVEIVTLHQVAVNRGLIVGKVYPVIDVEEDCYVYVQADGYGITCLHAERVKPANSIPAYPSPPPEHVTTHPTEREQRIRQMAHEYIVAYLHTPVVDNIHVQEFIKIATELYDTPIPPPSKP